VAPKSAVAPETKIGVAPKPQATVVSTKVNALPPTKKAPNDGLAKVDLHYLMNAVDFTNLTRRMIYFKVGDKAYNALTHVDIELQRRLVESMDRKNSRHIGIVALEPDSGRVVTMASFDRTTAPLNPCLSDQYPAASLFKIVSAVAAAEKKGYRAGTVLKYNGYAHTLYKKQLKETNNKYTNRISFQNAFAKSVNPVFGKIGALYLKGDALAEYAEIMGFNRQLPFELPMPPSHFTPSDKPYRWAELASGFNRETTISPLHAAVLAGAVVNGGQLIEPTVIAAMRNEVQDVVYRSEPRVWARVMGPDTVETLGRLMETTIRSGTGRKVFRSQRRDKVLSKLIIGGKTGSIYNRAHDARFDWFAGYAREKGGDTSLAIAVVVAHEEYIGRRAGEYARIAFRHYFGNHFAQQEKKGDAKTAS
jgi:cell division protein FtsI/penicillin-binding protein 2